MSAWSDWYALAVSIDLLLVRVPVWVQFCAAVCLLLLTVPCGWLRVKNVLWLSSRGSSRGSLPAAVVLLYVHLQEHRPSLADRAGGIPTYDDL